LVRVRRRAAPIGAIGAVRRHPVGRRRLERAAELGELEHVGWQLGHLGTGVDASPPRSHERPQREACDADPEGRHHRGKSRTIYRPRLTH
jgi:hypothetical protein